MSTFKSIPVVEDWLLTLDGTEPVGALEALEELGVPVVADAPATALLVAGETRPVVVVVADVDDVDRLAVDADQGLLVVVRGVVGEDAAVRLEDAGIGYIDASGRSWLPGQPRTRRRRALAAGASEMRPAGVRLAQLLADHPDEKWTLTRLAKRGSTTRLSAQRLLARLEDEGLLERVGRGPTAGRRVIDSGALRRWLARHGRPARTHRLSCFVPDTSPEKLAELSGGRLILTGAAAAASLGMPVVSNIQRPMYRVPATGDELEDVPSTVGGFRTDRGANLVLVADPHRLAALDATTTDEGIVVAPLSRVMLDLYLEPRGAAAADVFLDLWARST